MSKIKKVLLRHFLKQGNLISVSWCCMSLRYFFLMASSLEEGRITMWQRRKVNLDLPTQLQLVSPLYPFLSITKVPTVSRSNYTSRSDHASLVCLWRSLLFVFFMENQRGRVDVGKLTQWLPFILCPGSCTLLCQSGSTSFLDLLLLPQHFKIDRNTNLTNILLKITLLERKNRYRFPLLPKGRAFS